MSFRKEIKFCLDKTKIKEFMEWIQKKGAKEIYKERIVNSVYFDNEQFLMYHDSVEGVIPRKKIRLRSYNKKKHYLIEKKISSPDGRFKLSKNFYNQYNLFKKGIIDNQYGICKPKVVVNYERNYFSFKNFRITLDKNIHYTKYNINLNSNIKIKDHEYVAEVKGINLNQDFLDQYFPFISSRFSKYCRGIDLIYKFN